VVDGARLENEARERVQATPTHRNAHAISGFTIYTALRPTRGRDTRGHPKGVRHRRAVRRLAEGVWAARVGHDHHRDDADDRLDLHASVRFKSTD